MSDILEGLNPEQRKAAQHLDGPLLILAGAGSGKTRVVTHRIAWLIGEKQVPPWHICAITFTNKAAGEMRERVDRLVGFGAEAVHVATFHSTCVRILRQFIDRLGYQKGFDIYDTDDTKSLMKDICRQLEINTKLYKERMFLAQISHLKDELIGPADYREEAQQVADREMLLLADVYTEYQKRLRRSNAVDFDDLIVLTVRLFRECPDVLAYWQDRYRYLMVDEYQDTNKAQFVFVSLLAQKYRNLCVVGDDDQSIYRFRGADIGNILNFEQIFPDTKVIRLEQNYRSTQNILDAANAVIAHNRGRKEKKLWTGNGGGDPVRVRRFENAQGEARYIVDDIARQKRNGAYDFKESAVLYRTNAQSRALEEQLLYENIPYTIIGGTNFYARREIKDVLAYLKVLGNSSDDVAAKRIINVPKRGIGATSVGRADAYAASQDIPFFDVCRMADKVPGIGRGGLKMREFCALILKLQKKARTLPPSDIIRLVLEETGYAEELRLEGTDESKDRLQNLDELLGKAVSYEASFAGESVAAGDLGERAEGRTDAPEQDPEKSGPTLQGFLEEVALVADIDSLDGADDRVPLMTLHSAKGLEFGNVYLAGMDEGLFPGYRSISSEDSADLEEERRLCYVGITRAKRRLTLTGARMRMLHGQPEWYMPSRFLEELGAQGAGDTSTRAEADFGEDGRTGRGGSAFGNGRDARTGNSYGRRRPAPPGKPFYLQQEVKPVAPGTSLGYDVGDTVRHVKFGQGVVQDIRDGGRDREVTVEFEKFGVKKMFAGFAKLEKV